MPDVFLHIIIILLVAAMIPIAMYGDAESNYKPFKIVLSLTVVFLVWFIVYCCTPYRIATTYEVKPEYNADKTIQFVTLKEPNSSMGDKIVLTYPTFKRFLKDDEVVTVKQKDWGYYWGMFPVTKSSEPRNILEIK